MKQSLLALFAGILFGAGLVISHMVDPGKVQGFLDITGDWDPSLGLVMGGAICVTFIAFNVLLPKCSVPVLGDKFRLPGRTDIDRPLLIGAMLFGIGWGMTGYCPGPVVASLGFGFMDPFIVLVCILAGFVFHKKFLQSAL